MSVSRAYTHDHKLLSRSEGASAVFAASSIASRAKRRDHGIPLSEIAM